MPWPEGSGDVLFVRSASNPVERALLDGFIDAGRGHTERRCTIVDVDPESGRSPDAATIETVSTADAAVTVVPLRVVWAVGTTLHRSGPRLRDLVFGDPRNPRPWLARLIHRRHPDRARPIAARPATIGELRARYDDVHADAEHAIESFGEFVVRLAGVALDVSERRLEGRRYKVPRSVLAGIESSPTYELALHDLAEAAGTSPADVRLEAHEYLDEMVAAPSTFFIDWTGKITRWIVSLGYGEIVTDPVGLERARDHVRDHPAALLWTHKSHLDGIALMSVMYDHDFPSPHQMGGINMAFRGIAGASRRAGIIFIRRSFADNPVYKMTLQHYLGYLLDKRFPFSWSFEGTRSRTGKLMPPRYGLLKYVVDAAHATRADDLHIIPVAISYDLIGEAGDYVRLEAGQPKPPENFGWFVSYLRRLRTPSGRMYVDFGEPVVVRSTAEAPQQSDLAPIAFEVARRVNAMVPVTLPALMFTALLGAAPRAMTYGELDAEMRSLISWLHGRGVRMASRFDEAETEELSAMAEIVFDRGIVERHSGGSETVFRIADDKHEVASYHRNTIIHYFVDRALTELALMRVADREPELRVDAFWNELGWLRDLLKFEFFHTPTTQFANDVRASLDAQAPDWESVLSGSSGEVRAMVQQMSPIVAHATIRQFLEAYWIVADRFARLDGDESLDEATCVDAALGEGRQAFLQQRISSRASIGKQMFKNAYSMLASRGLVEPGGAATAARRQELAGELYECVRVLAQLRTVDTTHPEHVEPRATAGDHPPQ